MNAFSLNYRDLLVVNGVGRWRSPVPRIPLSDGVGIVTATGNGVSRVKVGDRVAPIFYPKWLEGRVAAEKMGQALGGAATDGVLAEYTLVDQASLVHVLGLLQSWEREGLRPSQPFVCGAIWRLRRQIAPQRGISRGPQAPEPPRKGTLHQP